MPIKGLCEVLQSSDCFIIYIKFIALLKFLKVRCFMNKFLYLHLSIYSIACLLFVLAFYVRKFFSFYKAFYLLKNHHKLKLNHFFFVHTMLQNRASVSCKEPIEVVSYKIGVCKVSPNGKECQTDFQRLSFNGKTSVVLCHPKTGRMHQIRVHLQYLGNPSL